MMAPPAAADEWDGVNLNLSAICKECKEVPPNLVEEFSSGDLVCGSCGLVIGDRIVDTRSEWRTFANDDQATDDPSRVGDGANELLNGSQLTTSIAFDPSSNRAGQDLSRAHARANVDKTNKVLVEAYKIIGQHCDAINIPKNVSDTAKHLFKMQDDAKAAKGKSQESIIAGCVFIACRQCGVPRTFREIYALTKVSKKEIGKTFKHLEKFFNQKRDSINATKGHVAASDEFKSTSSTSAKELCVRFCSQLGLKNQMFVKVSQGIADSPVTLHELAGRSPLSVAAACIYMAAHLLGSPRTAKEISGIAGVSDGTIRNSYKFLYLKKETIIKDDWIRDGRGSMDNLPGA
ncbi:cyclin-like protein [Calycina marina]|uniref:Transcription initiation factor IIB n=1 Tax=Calycina marina TaxID=1763456 RepID=A0A9P7Z9W6_9HELO|nr:cyclin-like protein [Calycina marina]